MIECLTITIPSYRRYKLYVEEIQTAYGILMYGVKKYMLFLDELYTFSYVLQLVFTANWCCFIVFYFKMYLRLSLNLAWIENYTIYNTDVFCN